MLTQLADGVLLHQSKWMESNAVILQGDSGVLVVDPGIHAEEIVGIAKDLAATGQSVVAGFSTHPHWDHLLWHASLGDAPRYATALAATTAKQRLAGAIDAKRFGIPDEVSLELLGGTTGLPSGAENVPWDGPGIRIIEHNGHAPGHGALLIETARVLVAGDMLSDVFIPMLELNGTVDPIGDYLAALELFGNAADEVDLVVPGHGSVGDAAELRTRIERDRAYVEALRDGRAVNDPRIGPQAKPGWEFVNDVHERQVQQLAARNEEDPK